MFVSAIKTVTSRVLPRGKHFRRLPFGPATGCTMKVNLHYDLRLFLGLYEIETQRWFKELVKPGFKSFDVGGAGGYDALLLSKLAGCGEVVSFECESHLFDEMEETFARNDLPIKAVRTFVCDFDDGEHMSLDIAADKFFIPDFIKMDIEGAEASALEGAAKILRERKPNMIVEVHGEEVEKLCLKILGSCNYRPIIVNRNRLLAESRPLQHNRWLICHSS